MPISNTPSPLSNIIAAKTYNAAWFSGSTKELQITNAIAAAVADGALYVYVPANMLPYNAAAVTFNTAVSMIREGSNHSVTDVKAYGAAGDNTTDDTAAFLAAVASVPFGGRFVIPSGKYKLTNEIRLHAGIIVEGMTGASDNIFGAPPAFAVVQSYLWQATAGKAIFVIGGGMNTIIIRDIAFSDRATSTFSDVPAGLTKFGIKIEGTYPEYVWNLTFERLLFYNLDRGISCVDTQAGVISGPHPFDWSVSPVAVRQCDFRNVGWGVFINTNNADMWEFDTLLFPSIPATGIGIYLYRFGTMRIVNTAGGSAAINGNSLIQVEGNGLSGADLLTIVNCGAETCTHFMYLTATGTYNSDFKITMTDCWNWDGADVHLGNRCQFISRSNEFQTPVYMAHASAFVSSYDDWFAPGNHFSPLGGLTRSQIQNYLPNATAPDTNIPGAIFNGQLRLRKSVTAIVDATLTPVAFLTIPNIALSTSFLVTVLGSIGAGGAVGPDEATASNTYIVTLTRTPGKNAVASISAAFGGSAVNVAGGTTVTCIATLGAMGGAVGAVNQVPLNVTITKAGGASNNHTCLVTGDEMNSIGSGTIVT